VDEPEPGAAIAVGLKFALAPVGSPEAESEIAELKLPEPAVEIVTEPEAPCAIFKEVGAAAIVKSPALGLKIISMTGCSSIPLGATPVCPWRKSNIPTPVIRTGVFVVLKLEVGVNTASNCARACEMPAAKGLPAATQALDGISAIIVCPAPSSNTKW